jgi:F-type H+-transporting ATPase subunit b
MEIDIKQILVQALNFGVLFFILAKFLFRPILDILDKRSRKIEEGLELAELNKKAQEQIEVKSQKVLDKAEQKGAELIESARRESKELGRQLIETAKLESEKVISKQQASFLEHMQNEERQFKNRVTELVVSTTQKVLGDTLSPKDVKLITKKEIAKLSKAK